MVLLNTMQSCRHIYAVAKNKRILLKAIASLIFTYFLFSPNFSAQFGVIDDHEIIAFLGTDLDLPFREIPLALQQTEVTNPGVWKRFRPTYWSARLLEIALWGDNVFLWYLFRFLIFSSSFFISWLLLARFLGDVAAGISTAALFSNHYWSDIFARLGPAEAYGLLGISLYSFSATMLWELPEGKKKPVWWTALASGGILAMGAKENFIFILPLTIIILYRSWRRRSLDTRSSLVSIIHLGFGFFVITVILAISQKSGTDIYQNSTDISGRLKLVSDFFSFSHIKAKLPLLISAALLTSATIATKTRYSIHITASYIHSLIHLFLIELFLLLAWYFQYFFYNGTWPTGTRYDFPGMFAENLGYFLLAYPSYILIQPRNLSQKQPARHRAMIFLYFILFIFLSKELPQNLNQFRQSSISNKNKTVSFAKDINTITGKARENPETPIVFEIHDVWDWEPAMLSLRRFFLSHGVVNPLFLRLEGLSSKKFKEGSIESKLTRQLEDVSENGDFLIPNDSIAHTTSFSPLRFCPDREQCFVLGFSGQPKSPGHILGKITY